MFEDSGVFDLFFDILETLTPSIMLFIMFFNKHKNILKLIGLFLFTLRIIYKMNVLNLKDEKVSLNYKLISNIINILIIKYIVIKEFIINKKKNKKLDERKKINKKRQSKL